jgi:hypothetical protein
MANLCHICRSILLNEAKVESQVVTSYEELGRKPRKLGAITIEYERKDTYPNFPALRESAPVCRFCQLLLETINAKHGEVLQYLADMSDDSTCENQVIITDVRYQTFTNDRDGFETKEMCTSLKGLLVRMIFPDSEIPIPKLEIWFELSAHEGCSRRVSEKPMG